MKKMLLIPILIGTLALVIVGFNNDNTQKETKPNLKQGFVIIQLFTSQGCSSCPPADMLLDKTNEEYKDKEVYTLSYHVDYWNRLGWKDPYSSKIFSDKQYEYSRQFGGSTVYTPQAIINGQIQFTGSNSDKMDKAIKYYLQSDTQIGIDLTNIKSSASQVSTDFNLETLPKNSHLVIALVVDSRNTSVKRGENVGKTLKNTNIVAVEKSAVQGKKAGNLELEIPDWIETKDKLSLVAYIQKEDLQILGATKVAVKR